MLDACLESLPCLDLSSAANQCVEIYPSCSRLILDDICGFEEGQRLQLNLRSLLSAQASAQSISVVFYEEDKASGGV